MLVDTEPETREKLRRHIDKYIIADDVTLDDATDRLAVLSIEGPQAETVVAGWARPPRQRRTPTPPGTMPPSPGSAPPARPASAFSCPRERPGELIARLAEIPQATAEDQRTVRLEHGTPRYGEDITDATLPQESQQMHGVSFNKGCYLGQEIVERIRARGQVHRTLQSLQYEPGKPPEAQITSEAWSPALGRIVALGYVRS